MNLVGNHTEYKEGAPKLKGLLYKDFCLCDNLVIILHGKIITKIDIMNKKKHPQHLTLNDDREA